MINKKFMILAIFLVSLLAVSAVSAADNATGDIVGVKETTDEVVSVNENQTISEDDVLRDSPGTFTDLAKEIANAKNTLNLNRNYTYIGSDSNYKSGITIDKSITINGNGYTINGNNQARIFQIDASNVVLNNINFANSYSRVAGGAIYGDASNYTLSNCNFMNSHSSQVGGAAYLIGSYATVSGCSFVDCYSNSGAGSVYMSGSENVLVNCSFVNSRTDSWNSQPEGGAVYWSGRDGILSGCNFVNSYAKSNGGAVLLERGANCVLSDCSFINCSTGADGGSVKWIGSSGTLIDCRFENSNAKRWGGAVYWSGPYGVLSSCSFINSHAEEKGGGIYFNGEYCSLISTSFKGCTAKEGSDWYSNYPVIVIDKISTVITAPSVTTTYGVSKKLIATLKDINNNILVGEKISIVLNNKEQTLTTNSKGQVSLAIPTNLAPKTYVATIKYAGNDKYASSSTITNVIVNKASSTLTAPNVVTNYNSGKNLVATLKDASGKVISGAKVTIKLGTTTKTLTTNSNGQVSLTTDGLIPDTYVATISFEGNDVYDKSSTTAKVTINKLDTKLTARYDANSKNIVATVKDSNGNPIKGIRVGFALNGVKYMDTDANGQAKYSTAGLADGTYKVTVQASGNEIYKDSNKETVTFTIGSKEMSKIFLRNALYFVTQTKLVQVTLWDGNNQPLAGKTVYIRAYDSVWHGVTDENGDAFVRVGIGFGTHDATVSFDGDDQYNASTRAGYIRVIKQTPSVMVRGADTMFKATNPVKIVKVHLRDRYDQPLPEGSKIVLKLNGKTYIGFTDAEGVARIAISINTVGTFTAQAMYGGNSAYNPVTRDVKIRIV